MRPLDIERIRASWFDHADAATVNSPIDGLLTDLLCSKQEARPRSHREPAAP
ncbi:hypothetical protein [Streptomyces sp. NPDC059616]|uniref:hypothetical protein n=1 Tax=unclassified Streptomyces TaxID=2593676 RepID=UPI00362AD7D2